MPVILLADETVAHMRERLTVPAQDQIKIINRLKPQPKQLTALVHVADEIELAESPLPQFARRVSCPAPMSSSWDTSWWTGTFRLDARCSPKEPSTASPNAPPNSAPVSDIPEAAPAFSGGALLTRADCAARLRELHPDIAFQPGFLVPVSPRQILVRMLNNLLEIYLQRDRFAKALVPLEMILHLEPGQTAAVQRRHHPASHHQPDNFPFHFFTLYHHAIVLTLSLHIQYVI